MPTVAEPRKRSRKVAKQPTPAEPHELSDALNQVLPDVRELVVSARAHLAQSVNSTLTLVNWQIGHRLLIENLTEGRGEYGQRVLSSMAQALEAEFGKGFAYSALTRMVRFADAFPDKRIVATLSQHLSWSHFVAILPVKDALARDFYAELCRVERWSVRTLRQKIGGMLYERTALYRQSASLIRSELDALREEDRLSPNLVFRDPTFLSFWA